MLGVRLRPSRIDASKGALEELERVVGRIRERWPEVEITVRGDSGFCRDRLMAWCEEHGARYVFGMARNPRLQRMIEEELEASKAECRDSGEASRRYRELRYRTLDSWSCERRVVGKAEWLPGPRGSNPRFVVSNIADDDIEARALYEDLYCARGDMENRIKEQQLDLFADRTPAHVMRANQLRAYFSAFAGALMQVIRTFGLKGTELARAQAGTIRTRLLKIAGSIRVTTRRIAGSGSRSPRYTRGTDSSGGSPATSRPPSNSSYAHQHPRNAPTPPPRVGSPPPGRCLEVRPAAPVHAHMSGKKPRTEFNSPLAALAADKTRPDLAPRASKTRNPTLSAPVVTDPG